MLTNLYNQIILMSVVFSGLYLMLKFYAKGTMKLFTSSWHYYTYIWLYLFLRVPFHKLLPRLYINFSLQTSNETNYSISHNPLLSKLSCNNGIVTIIKKPISMVTSSLLPHFLMAGTLIFTTVVLMQNIIFYYRFTKKQRIADNPHLLNILSQTKQTLKVSNNVLVYISDYTCTPFIYGFLKPRIVMPNTEFSSKELQYLFHHELTHWNRRDSWLKLFMLIINALHWFNPLVYLARQDICYFCELSCDERVTKSMNKVERRWYCELLLSQLLNLTDLKTKLFSAFCDKRKIERRINRILENQNAKQRRLRNVFAVVITFLIMSSGIVASHAISKSNAVPPELSYLTSNSNIIDAVINASQSTHAVDALFGDNTEIYAIEDDILYYSKIYNSFEDVKVLGEESFLVSHDNYTTDVSLKSAYRIAKTDKFIANYVGVLKK